MLEVVYSVAVELLHLLFVVLWSGIAESVVAVVEQAEILAVVGMALVVELVDAPVIVMMVVEDVLLWLCIE